MPSRRPYLIRALYQWLVDAGDLPHLLVDATVAGVDVPDDHVRDGRIVLNVGPDAVQALTLDNDEIRFVARFKGVSRTVCLPPLAVIAIYGRDSGEGMMFGAEDDGQPENAASPLEDDKASKPGKPSLKIIK